MKKRFWLTSRKEEMRMSKQLTGVLENRAKGYIGFQQRSRDTIDAVWFFIQATKLICKSLGKNTKAVLESKVCKRAFEEPQAEEPSAPSNDMAGDRKVTKSPLESTRVGTY